MGIKERRAREKEQRKNSIIDAAEKVFFSKGMSQATMDEVAKAAELSKGTLYLYFKSKEDLYLAIVLRGHELLYSMFEEATTRRPKGRTKVMEMGQAYFDFYRRYPDYFNAMLYYENYELDFNDENPYAQECHQSSKRALNLLADTIQLGIDDGTVRRDLAPLKVAFNLWGQAMGLVQLISLKERLLEDHFQIEIKELKRTFFALVDQALKPQKEGNG